MRQIRLIAIAFALNACGSRSVVHQPVPGAQTIVVVSTLGVGATLRATGAEVLRATPLGDPPRALRLDEPLEGLFVSYYEQTLETLALEEGVFDLDDDACDSRAIPPPFLVRAIKAGSLADVAEADVANGLRALRFPAASGFVGPGRIRRLETIGRPAPMIRRNRTVNIESEGIVYTFDLNDPDSEIEPTNQTPISLPGDVITAYYEHASGVAFVGTASRRLYCGTWERGFTLPTNLTFPGRIHELAGPRNATDPFEVFVSVREDVPGRFDGSTYRLTAGTPTCAVSLQALDDPSALGTQHEAILEWLGPGDALIVSENRAAYRWRVGRPPVFFDAPFEVEEAVRLDDGRVMLFSPGLRGPTALRYAILDAETGLFEELVIREELLIDLQRALATSAGTVVAFGASLAPVYEFRPSPAPIPDQPFGCEIDTVRFFNDNTRTMTETDRELVMTGSEERPNNPGLRDWELVTFELP